MMEEKNQKMLGGGCLKFNDNGANLLSFNEENKKITQAAMVQDSKDFKRKEGPAKRSSFVILRQN